MSQIRSTKGCWTCKLRRKKCSEEKPACVICSSLSLQCSGYGLRPDWMDGGPKEKDSLVAIQETVKRVTSQKKRAAMQQRRQRPTEQGTVSIDLLDSPSINAQAYHQLSPTKSPSLQEDSHLQPNNPLLIDGPPLGLTPENTAAYIAQNESVLLMHYLDYVFPCQFRFYQPSLEDGGRGWLLSLLMQTKPLYHAACSLAAYHRQVKYCLDGGMKKGCFTTEALHLQYDVAITELRRYLEVLVSSDRERTLAEDVQLLCSIVLLISIEGYISSTETWHVHLAAALSIFPDINKRVRDIVSQNKNTLTFRAALSFFSTILSTYSIISCATISPEIFMPCSHKIDPEFIHFNKIIGCESWVMLSIVDIIVLEQWKNEMKAAGQLSIRELASRGNEIEAGLMGGFATIQESKPKSNGQGSFLQTDDSSVNSSVTRTYYFAALVYLQVVISGAFPNLPEIRHAVAQSMEAFKALPDPELVNNLIWPFCITGCMALESDHDFFREFSLFGNPNDGKFGASKARVIMEECWRLRKLDSDSGKADWRAAMDHLGFRILLV